MSLKDIEVQKFFDRKKNKLNIETEVISTLSEIEKSEPMWSQSGAKVEPMWSQCGAAIVQQLEPQPEPNNNESGAKVEPKWGHNQRQN